MENNTSKKDIHEAVTVDEICAELEKYWDRQDRPKPGEFTVEEVMPKMGGCRETVRTKLKGLAVAGILSIRKCGNKIFYHLVNKE